MFPLLGQAFRIDVSVPHHQRGDNRVRHLSASQRNIGEASIAQINLTNVDTVAVLGEGSIIAVVAKGDVSRARISTGLETDPEEPIVCQRSTQTDTQAITFAFTLLPVMPPSNARGRCRQWFNAPCFTAAIFVTQPSVAVELKFSDRGREFPFPGGSGRNLLCQFGTDFLGLLIGDDLFPYQ